MLLYDCALPPSGSIRPGLSVRSPAASPKCTTRHATCSSSKPLRLGFSAISVGFSLGFRENLNLSLASPILSIRWWNSKFKGPTVACHLPGEPYGGSVLFMFILYLLCILPFVCPWRPSTGGSAAVRPSTEPGARPIWRTCLALTEVPPLPMSADGPTASASWATVPLLHIDDGGPFLSGAPPNPPAVESAGPRSSAEGAAMPLPPLGRHQATPGGYP